MRWHGVRRALVSTSQMPMMTPARVPHLQAGSQTPSPSPSPSPSPYTPSPYTPSSHTPYTGGTPNPDNVAIPRQTVAEVFNQELQDFYLHDTVTNGTFNLCYKPRGGVWTRVTPRRTCTPELKASGICSKVERAKGQVLELIARPTIWPQMAIAGSAQPVNLLTLPETLILTLSPSPSPTTSSKLFSMYSASSTMTM